MLSGQHGVCLVVVIGLSDLNLSLTRGKMHILEWWECVLDLCSRFTAGA
jgi:hypothetical protein